MFQKREKNMMFRYLGLVCVIALSVLSTLGSGGGGGGGETVTIDLTGNWRGTWNSSVANYSGNLSGTLTHSGTSISGTMNVTGSPCISSGTVSGTGAGGSFSASIDSGQDSLQLQGSYTATSISGTYSVPNGVCAGDTGTFSLNQVTQLPPSNVSVLSTTSDKVELSWLFTDGSSSKARGIAIARKTGISGIYAVVGSVPANQTTYVDTGLSPDTIYYYKLYSYESYDPNSISPYTGEVSVTTQSFSTVPAAPSGLIVTALNGWTIDLSWSDNATNEDGFVIEKSTDGVNYTVVSTVNNNVVTFKDEYVIASTEYFYRVNTYNNQGSSTYTTPSNITTPIITPTDISGGIASDTTLTLSNSPYLVSSNVVLAPSYTLRIEPGVHIRFASSTQIEIRGYLDAVGTVAAPIVFTASDPTSGSKLYWNGIYVANILGGSATIQHASISNASNAVSVDCCDEGGPIGIYDTVFDTNDTALNGYVGSSWDELIYRSIFMNNNIGVIQADKIIAYSTFKNNTYGLFETERVDVFYSSFTGHAGAALSGGRGNVKYCTVTNNNVGIQSFFEGFDLSYNSIANNNDKGIILGTYNGYSPSVNYNNIYGNTNYNIVNNDSGVKEATNNWWGSTVLTDIESKIFDFYDDTNFGIIEYSPYLDKPIDITP